MGIKHTNIKLAFRRALIDLNDIPEEEDGACAWEGELFEPPEGEEWIKETYIIVSEQLVATDLMGASGIYQIDIYGNPQKGDAELERIRDVIKARFKPGSLQNVELGINIAIDKCEPGGARTEHSTADAYGEAFSWRNIPIFVYWRSYATEDIN
jgi:hypothetical protein